MAEAIVLCGPPPAVKNRDWTRVQAGRMHIRPTADGQDIETRETRKTTTSTSHQSHTGGESDALTPENEDMEEKQLEKAPFSWSRIRASPSFTAHVRTSSTRDRTDTLTYTPHQGPASLSINPRPTSSVYDDADTLQPPSPTYNSPAQRGIESPAPRDEIDKQYVNYSRPSSSRRFTPSPAPPSVRDEAGTSQHASQAYECEFLNDLPTAESRCGDDERRDCEKCTFIHPHTSAPPHPPPRLTPPSSVHHHPGNAFQPPRLSHHASFTYQPPHPSPQPPSPLPPFHQPRRPRHAGARKPPSFLLPNFIFPRLRLKYRKRLSAALFALLFVGSLGTGIGFLIAGCGDDRRLEGEEWDTEGRRVARVEWMIVVGGSILGLHGVFMIIMLVLYGPSCF